MNSETAPRVPKRTVLVVDDDENFRNVARQILAPCAFDVMEAADVEACLGLLRSHIVDVVLLDIVMPDRDGIDALEDLRTISPWSKIVTVSGAQDSKFFLATSAYLGAHASLAKSEIASLRMFLNVLLEGYVTGSPQATSFLPLA